MVELEEEVMVMVATLVGYLVVEEMGMAGEEVKEAVVMVVEAMTEVKVEKTGVAGIHNNTEEPGLSFRERY